MQACQAYTAPTAAVAVWALYSGFLHLQLFLEEAIGIQLLLEKDDENKATVVEPRGIQLWNWLGVCSWCVLVVSMISVACDRVLHTKHTEKRSRCMFFLSVLYAVFVYLTMIVLGFLAPNNQWRLIHRARENLASGGAGYRGCFVTPNADALRVLDNETYITLIDDGWQVDLNDTTSTAEDGWTYLSAPIVYGGPMPNCKFDPPISAYCITKTEDLTPENCFFEPAGAYTTIRKAKQAEYLEGWLLDKVPAGHDRVFEFNSFPRKDLAEYVSSMEGIRDKQYTRVVIVWYAFSSACLCVCCLFILILQSREPERPIFDEISGDFVMQRGGSDGKMQDYGDCGDYGEMRDYGNDQV
ncbi:hypothetical protein DIPPA_01832 [Diplonema papillatum]|nr:hypothetical protein DIPPA_01832 [Diplonema papillatum]